MRTRSKLRLYYVALEPTELSAQVHIRISFFPLRTKAQLAGNKRPLEFDRIKPIGLNGLPSPSSLSAEPTESEWISLQCSGIY